MLERIRNIPTTMMFLCFFVLSCVLAYCPTVPKIILAVGFFVCALLCAIRPLTGRLFNGDRLLARAFVCIFAGAFAASAVSFFAFDLVFKGSDSVSGLTDTAEFYITGCEKEYSYTAFYNAQVTDSSLLRRGTKVILEIPSAVLYEGDTVKADVVYRSVSDGNSGTFDGRQYYLPKGIMLFAESENYVVRDNSPRFSIRKFFDSVRFRLSAAVRANCRDDTGSLAAAVLLGDKNELSREISRDFRRLGISHLLVISGTHFSALITLLEYALRRARIKPRFRALAGMLFSLLYMFLTGFTPSVVRAGIMHILAQLSCLLLRKPNIINSYALSGALIALVNPFAVIDTGLLLSYTATLASIIYLTSGRKLITVIFGKKKNAETKHPRLRRLLIRAVDCALLTFTVTLYTLPLSWLCFGEISLVSIPVNLIAIPLMTVFMYLAAIYLLLYPLALFIVPLSKLIDLYGGFVLSLFDRIAHLKGIIVSVAYGFTVFFIIPLTVMLVLFPLVRKKRAFALSAAGIFTAFLCTVIAVNAVSSHSDRVTYVPKGINDGLAVRSGGKILLADMSTASFGYSYELTDCMREMNATEADAILLTHYHNKHISYFGSLCEREIVSELLLPSPQNESETAIYDMLLDTAEEYGVSVVTLSPDEEYILGNAAVSIFPRTYSGRTSHPISGLKLECGDETVILVSSSWNDGENVMTESVKSADYVFFGEHSPVYKTEIATDFSPDVKAILIGEKADGMLNGVTREKYSKVILPREKYTVNLGR